MINEDFEIGCMIKENSPHFVINVVSSHSCKSGGRSMECASYYSKDLTINDPLGLILCYLKYGRDKDLKNPEVGKFISEFLAERDLISDDIKCRIESIEIIYVDRISCLHKVNFPKIKDINEIIEKIKIYENNRRTLE